MNVLGLPLLAALAATLATGLFCGLLNGVLVGYLRLRAFITTLVTLVIYRAPYDIVFPRLASAIVGSTPDSPTWDFIGYRCRLRRAGIVPTLLGDSDCAPHRAVPSRVQAGVAAVGGAATFGFQRRDQRRRTVCLAYVSSGILTAVAAFLFSARLGSTGADTGIGLEISVVTAVVLGGVSLGGGFAG